MGYVLSALGESIHPLPDIENAEAPTSIVSAARQKYVWFFGPLDHFSYYQYVRKRFPHSVSRVLASWLLAQGFLPAMIWAFQGVALVALGAISWNGHGILRVCAAATLIVYGPLSFLTTLAVAGAVIETGPDLRPTCSRLGTIAALSLPVAALHSIPPWLSIHAKLRHLRRGIEPQKPKTER